jgi:hypothetical protein
MHISIVAMNRIAETQAEKDPSCREGLKRHGKMLLSDARKLSDAELLGKLTRFNIVLDQAASQARGQSREASKRNSTPAVLRIKSKVDFGEEGLPLDKLPKVQQYSVVSTINCSGDRRPGRPVEMNQALRQRQKSGS